jgi:hypothetical protein
LTGHQFLNVGLTLLRNTAPPPHRLLKKRIAQEPMKNLPITLSFLIIKRKIKT